MAKNYRKKPQAKKRPYRKRKPSMKLYADRMKITKCHKPSSLETLYPFGRTNAGLRDSNWYQYPLCNLTGAHNAANLNLNDNFDIDMGKRESSRIFHKNSTVKFILVPSKNYIEAIQYRYVCGYFKGDDNVGTQELTNGALTAGYPNIHSRLKRGKAGRNDFYFTDISKTHTMTPKMIYDANGSDDQTVGETMNALWLPKTHSCNFRCNKIRQFESDESDSLDGWYPFFAIQCLPVVGSSGFNAPDLITDESTWSGLSTPTPMLQLEIATWFQDIN